ncbi:hypothetical protein DFH11DRAFT_1605563, partial [Phellopilus nigrolimitatus]
MSTPPAPQEEKTMALKTRFDRAFEALDAVLAEVGCDELVTDPALANSVVAALAKCRVWNTAMARAHAPSRPCVAELASKAAARKGPETGSSVPRKRSASREPEDEARACAKAVRVCTSSSEADMGSEADPREGAGSTVHIGPSFRSCTEAIDRAQLAALLGVGEKPLLRGLILPLITAHEEIITLQRECLTGYRHFLELLC